MVGQIRRSPGTIGYVELSYALQNEIPFGLVQNKEGVPIKGSLESVTAAARGALSEMPDDLPYSLTNAPGRDAYPISGTVWAVLYVNQPADRGRAVVAFLRWITHEGQQYAEGLHYARLPQGFINRSEKRLDQLKVAK